MKPSEAEIDEVKAAALQRDQIAAARAFDAERSAELQARWDHSRELGDTVIARAREVDAVVVVLSETLSGLLTARAAFDASQPERIPGFVSLDGVQAAIAGIRQRLWPDWNPPMPTLATIVSNEIAAAMLLRPA